MDNTSIKRIKASIKGNTSSVKKKLQEKLHRSQSNKSISSAQGIQGTDAFFSFSSVKHQNIYSEEFSLQQCQKALASRPTIPPPPPRQIEEDINPFGDDGKHIESVYRSLLFAIYHSPNKPKSVSVDAMLHYAQRAFHITDAKHEDILDSVQSSLSPHWIIKVKACAGSKLKAMHPDGLSDPYCVISLKSNPSKKLQSSVQLQTLEPSWNEEFIFTSSMGSDIIDLEIWDFKEHQSLLKTVGQIREVKGMKGAKNYFKQISKHKESQTAAEHSLIGQIHQPIKELLGDDMEQWYQLHGKKDLEEDKKHRGNVLLRTHIRPDGRHPEIRGKDVVRDHQLLAQTLYQFELYETNEYVETLSEGVLSVISESLLQTHATVFGVGSVHMSLCRWLAAWNLHKQHQLSSDMLLSLLMKISSHSKEATMQMQLELSESLHGCMDHILSVLKNIHHMVMEESSLHDLSNSLKKAKEIQRVLKNYFHEDLELNEDVVNSVQDGNLEWFYAQMAVEELEENNYDMALQSLNNVLNAVLAFMKIAQECVAPMFANILHMDMFEPFYRSFEGMILADVKPVVTSISDMLKNDSAGLPEELIGSTVFRSYMLLQQFLKLGNSHDIDVNELIKRSHEWYQPALHVWLAMASNKVSVFISNAVSLDTWSPVDDVSRHSSSVVDAVYVMNEIIIFWKELKWPDSNEAYCFVEALIQVLKKTAHHYATEVVAILKTSLNDKEVISTKEIAIFCNQEFMQDHVIHDLFPSLETEKLCQEIENRDGGEDLGTSTGLMMELLNDSGIEERIKEADALLASWVNNMIHHTLERLNTKHMSSDWNTPLMSQLQELMGQLSDCLSQNRLFNFLQLLWTKTVKVISSFKAPKELKREYYHTVYNFLLDLREFFHGDGNGLPYDVIDFESFVSVRDMFYVRSLLTKDLITMYYQRRFAMQESHNDDNENALGWLTLKMAINKDHLNIELLNGKQLIVADSNGSSDPYVTFRLVPTILAPQSPKLHSSVQWNTLFPLFDETFTFELPGGVDPGALFLLMTVWDRDKIGFDDYMGEVIVPLENLLGHGEELEYAQPLQIPVTIPRDEVADILDSLKHRHHDSVATAFVKRERRHTKRQHISSESEVFKHLDERNDLRVNIPRERTLSTVERNQPTVSSPETEPNSPESDNHNFPSSLSTPSSPEIKIDDFDTSSPPTTNSSNNENPFNFKDNSDTKSTKSFKMKSMSLSRDFLNKIKGSKHKEEAHGDLCDTRSLKGSGHSGHGAGKFFGKLKRHRNSSDKENNLLVNGSQTSKSHDRVHHNSH